MKIDPQNLDRAELEQALADLGAPRYRGRQIFHWIHRRGVTDFQAMTNLGAEDRTALSAHFGVAGPDIVARQTSAARRPTSPAP